MAVIGSDFHGDVQKLEEFLAHKPEEKHIIVGDLLDSKVFGEEDSLTCLDLVLHANARNPELVDAVWGNHEVQYMYMAPFKCSGVRLGTGLGSKLDRVKHRFGVALVEDGYLITHAGVHPRLAKFEDVNEECAWLNRQWEVDYLNYIPQPYANTSSGYNPIFNIGKARKGPDEFGGIFWLDWRVEDVSAQYDQIFGHTNGLELYDMDHHGKSIVCVDTITNECFNTKTRKVEQYGFNR